MKFVVIAITAFGFLIGGPDFLNASEGLYKDATQTSAEFTSVATDRFVAAYNPGNGKGRYGVLVVGGSDGGLPMALAREVAQTGRPVLALAYFKEKSLPPELNEIALEYFEAPKNWLMAQPETKSDGLLVLGWSKGAELALLLASRDSRIVGVAAGAPSSHVWAGVLDQWDRQPSSSWAINGSPIEYIRYRFDWEYPSLKEMYQSSLSRADNREAARIAVENIDGPVLLLSGGQDTLWPAASMANEVCQTMRAAGKKCSHMNWPGAGHSLVEDDRWGGTKEANRTAATESKKAVYNFMSQRFSDEATG